MSVDPILSDQRLALLRDAGLVGGKQVKGMLLFTQVGKLVEV
jgi:hypothetical protein